MGHLAKKIMTVFLISKRFETLPSPILVALRLVNVDVSNIR